MIKKQPQERAISKTSIMLATGNKNGLVSRICDYTSVQAVRQVYDIGPLAGI
jgi:hypothetical protein